MFLSFGGSLAFLFAAFLFGLIPIVYVLVNHHDKNSKSKDLKERVLLSVVPFTGRYFGVSVLVLGFLLNAVIVSWKVAITQENAPAFLQMEIERIDKDFNRKVSVRLEDFQHAYPSNLIEMYLDGNAWAAGWTRLRAMHEGKPVIVAVSAFKEQDFIQSAKTGTVTLLTCPESSPCAYYVSESVRETLIAQQQDSSQVVVRHFLASFLWVGFIWFPMAYPAWGLIALFIRRRERMMRARLERVVFEQNWTKLPQVSIRPFNMLQQILTHFQNPFLHIAFAKDGSWGAAVTYRPESETNESVDGVLIHLSNSNRGLAVVPETLIKEIEEYKTQHGLKKAS